VITYLRWETVVAILKEGNYLGKAGSEREWGHRSELIRVLVCGGRGVSNGNGLLCPDQAAAILFVSRQILEINGILLFLIILLATYQRMRRLVSVYTG